MLFLFSPLKNRKEREIFNLVNSERAKAGLVELKWNSRLADSSYRKACDIYKRGYWSHNTPEGKTPWEFIRESGYRYIRAGENLADGYNDSHKLVIAWMNSPKHKEIILGDYKEGAIGVCEDVVALHTGTKYTY